MSALTLVVRTWTADVRPWSADVRAWSADVRTLSADVRAWSEDVRTIDTSLDTRWSIEPSRGRGKILSFSVSLGATTTVKSA